MDHAQKTSGMAIASLVFGILSFCLSIFAGIPAIILGIVSLNAIGRSQGALAGKGLAIAGIVTGCIGSLLIMCQVALLLPAISAAREAARRTQSLNQMRQIGVALSNYETAHNRLPPAGVDDAGVGPNLSWRVQLLPFLNEQALYDQFHLDEPWDSEHNLPLASQMPACYRNPNMPAAQEKTVYLAVIGPQATFQGGAQGPKLGDITDGVSKTVILVEANEDQAVTWTKPDDWELDSRNPRHGLGDLRTRGFLALFGDSRVAFIRDSTSVETVLALFTRDGNEPVDLSKL